jgi:hypothetical protein
MDPSDPIIESSSPVCSVSDTLPQEVTAIGELPDGFYVVEPTQIGMIVSDRYETLEALRSEVSGHGAPCFRGDRIVGVRSGAVAGVQTYPAEWNVAFED